MRSDREEDRWPTVPSWRLEGDWFDVCKCTIPCPCTFAQPPNEGDARASSRGTSARAATATCTLDGLNVVAVGALRGKHLGGRGEDSAIGIVHRRAGGRRPARGAADDLRRTGGRLASAGSPSSIGEVRGIEYAPIEFEIADDLALMASRDSREGRGSRRGADGADEPPRAAGAGPQCARRGGRPGAGRDLGHGDADEVEALRLQAGTGPAARASTSRSTGRVRTSPEVVEEEEEEESWPGSSRAPTSRPARARSSVRAPRRWRSAPTTTAATSRSSSTSSTATWRAPTSSGLTVAAVADTPKVMSDGNWRLGVFIDGAASDQQAAKLGAVFGGQLGGPMAALAPLVSENLGAERVPIEVREEGLRHSVRIGDAVDFEVEDVVSFGVETGEPARLTGIFHPAGSRADDREGDTARASTPSASRTRASPASRTRPSRGRPEREHGRPGPSRCGMGGAGLRRVRRARARLGLIALLFALAGGRLVVDGRSHARDGRRPGHRPRGARLVPRRLGGDDGRDDVPVGRADGRPLRPHGARARSSRRAATCSRPATW